MIITNKSSVALFSIFAVILAVSCNCSANNSITHYSEAITASRDSTLLDLSQYKKCDKYVINDTIDLQWKTLYLPDGVRLVMNRGLFKNGCIVGNNTRLKYKNAVFDKVLVKGTWIVRKISTAMFIDLSYDNSLKDVLALANPEINNQIRIEKGTYRVTASETSPNCMGVSSNTQLIVDGTIFLTPNGLAGYSILNVSGNNISISGKGSIIGDKPKHLGSEGEWGMGVYIIGGENVTIRNLSIKDCWGDCIYIRRNAKNITVENCILDNGRRQGISIISAQNVLIKNCTISNIGGTNPAYAIDVEPNEGDKVSGVKIINVDASNCRGGFECNGHANNSIIEDISIKNCRVSNMKRVPLRFIQANSVRVENCRVDGYKSAEVLFFSKVDTAYVSKITVDGIEMKGRKRILQSITSQDVNHLQVQ